MDTRKRNLDIRKALIFIDARLSILKGRSNKGEREELIRRKADLQVEMLELKEAMSKARPRGFLERVYGDSDFDSGN